MMRSEKCCSNTAACSGFETMPLTLVFPAATRPKVGLEELFRVERWVRLTGCGDARADQKRDQSRTGPEATDWFS